MNQTDTLLMLSGGIDSAYCLWQRVQQGLPTRTHHVVLRDHEGRQMVESRATAQVLAWMKDNGGAGLIHHTESHVDFGTLKWLPRNFFLWSYWAGAIMAAPSGQNLTNIILPRHSDAFTGGPESPGALKSDEAYRTTITLMTGREPTLVFPMVHMTKAEVIASMPEDLLRKCWWCRRPKWGQPCHQCATCKLVDPALPGGK